MNDNKFDSDDKSYNEDFFSKFGTYEATRAKNRQELIKDYCEFKRKDEESFHNRFADKKSKGESYLQEKSNNIVQLPKISSSPYELNPKTNQNTYATYSEEKLNDRSDLENLLRDKLIGLEKKLEDLRAEFKREVPLCNDENQVNEYCSTRNLKSPELFVNPGVYTTIQSQNSKNIIKSQSNIDPEYEEALRKRLHLIFEADKRLACVEDEYNKLKHTYNQNISHDFKILPTVNQPDERTFYAKHKLSVTNNHHDSKQKLQQEYRKDLEAQIDEARRKKMLEKSIDNVISDVNLSSPVTKDVNHYNMRYTSPEMQKFSPSSFQNGLEAEYSKTVNYDLVDNDNTMKMQSFTASKNKFLRNQNSSPNGLIIGSSKTTDLEAKMKKLQYAEELKKQIAEAKAKKELQKKEDEEYNRKIEQQILGLEVEKWSNVQLSGDVEIKEVPNSNNDPNEKKMMDIHGNDSILANQKDTQKSNYARGGHGIFGSPLTEVQKFNLQQYKEELAQQIAEKHRALEEEKLKEMELEKRDAERLEAERLRMQKEFEAEQMRKKQSREEQERTLALLNAEKAKSKMLTPKVNEVNEISTKKLTKVVREGKLKGKNSPKQKDSKPISPPNSPEILIGPEPKPTNHKKLNDSKGIKDKTDWKTKSILKQLHTLRTQLDVEKSRIESTVNRYQMPEGHDTNILNIQSDRPKFRPRVDRKAVSLFRDTSKITETNSSETENLLQPSSILKSELQSSSVLEELTKSDDAVKEKDQKQVAYLKAQDKYLEELKNELKQRHLSENLYGSTINNVPHYSREKLQTSQIFSDSKFINYPIEVKRSPRTKSPFEESINLDEITEKNKRRLRKLEAMQLLNDVNANPEAVLERFVAEHDRTFEREYKENMF